MNPLDAELMPIGAIAGGLVELGEDGDPAGATSVTKLVCDLPVEVGTGKAEGSLAVLLSPPRQPIVTTVMPVLHRLRLTVVPRADD